MRLFRKQHEEHSDEKLMQMVANGDQQAFSVLYDRYSGPLVSYFYRMLWKDKEKAEDFMQELFTKIIHKPHQFNPERSFKTWLFSAANNMCKNEYRKQEIRKPTSYTLDDGIQVAEERKDIHQQLDTDTFNDKLMVVLDGIDEVKRETFLLRHTQDFSIKEIAEAMGCSEGTVKSRLFYTTKLLAEALREYNPEQNEMKL